MSENLRNYTRAVYTIDAVVNRMPAEAWSSQSPCEEWTAREVLGHFMWGAQNLTNAARGGDPPAPKAEAEVATDDPPAAWVETRDALLAALDQQGALQRSFNGPFGPGTVDAFLPIHTIDGLIHAWDIATAGGIDAHLPADLAGAGADALASFGDALRRPGLFGPAAEGTSDDDPVTRLLAVAGRTP